MIRAVIDTNVIVSAALFAYSIPRKAFDYLLDKGIILVSEPALLELVEVFNRDKFNKYVDEDDRMKFLVDFLSETEYVETQPTVTACRDPKDNKFLDLAISGNAQYLISGDQDLLILNPFENIQITTPQDFLNSVAIP